uniref:Uncharacterized protein n=1 Tax=Avena sativa TaxID=4498 RepID=A0ACD5U9I0_AVESA
MSSSSSSSSKAKRSSGLQGPRPQPPSVSTRPSKKPRLGGACAPAGPVIVYERPPTVVYAGPDEFRSVVQSLTGQQPTLPEPEATSGARDDGGTSTSAAAEDLVLTHGQQQQQQLAPCAGDDASSLLSPSSIFSPATMQAIRELIS